jgi:hypothetical protein
VVEGGAWIVDQTSIEVALRDLGDAITRAGVTVPDAPPVDDDLAALRMAVAPLRLPDELVSVWRRFGGGPRWLVAGLDLYSPRACIDFRDLVLMPRCLLLIGGEGHGQCWLEMHGPDDLDGGAVWGGDLEEGEVYPIAPSLVALIAVTTVAWEQGVFRRAPDGRPHDVSADWDAWQPRAAAMLPRGEVVQTADVERWPARWLALEGLDPADARPRGGTTHVAGLALADGRLRHPSRVSGRVTGVTGILAASGGSVVRLDDGSGVLRIYVPRRADPFRLVRPGDRIEVDVEPVPADPAPDPIVDLAWVQAIATGVRHSA